MKSGPRVLVFPAWTANPYLNMLALAPTAQGYAFVNRTLFDSLMTELPLLQRGDVAHMHWTSPIAQNAKDARDARHRVARVVAALRAAQSRGVRVVWTVHNTLPHEVRHREPEIELYTALTDIADVVLVMSPATRELVSEVTEIDPAKIRRIPHPSYAGVYDTSVTRDEARARFALEPDEFAVMFLGRIRPYKGIDTLLHAVADLPERAGRRPVLLLAGAADAEAIDQIDALSPRHVRMVTRFRAVPDDEIAAWYAAADVAVFPYTAILNSGSIHLAATLGVPAILPGLPHLRDEFGAQPWVGFFDPAEGAPSLTAAIDGSAQLAAATPADYAAFTDPISPWRVSGAYLDLLDELTGRDAAEPAADHAG